MNITLDDREAEGLDTSLQAQQSQPLGDRAIGQLCADAQMPQDILVLHRQCNHAPRLPNSTQLLVVRQRESSSANQAPSKRLDNNNNQDPPAIPVPSCSPAVGGAEPWQLQYYNPPTRDIIERAKQYFRCDAASINSFPVHNAFDTKAIEYIDEAISERQMRHLVISEGKSTMSIYYTISFNPIS